MTSRRLRRSDRLPGPRGRARARRRARLRRRRATLHHTAGPRARSPNPGDEFRGPCRVCLTWRAHLHRRSPPSTATSPTSPAPGIGRIPDEEVHAFVNDLERPIGTHLYGRKLYEVLHVWETMDDPAPAMRDYATLWRASEKIVFSRTLDRGLQRADAHRAHLRPGGRPRDEGRGGHRHRHRRTAHRSGGAAGRASSTRSACSCHRSWWAAATPRCPTTCASTSSSSTSAASATASSTCATEPARSARPGTSTSCARRPSRGRARSRRAGSAHRARGGR